MAIFVAISPTHLSKGLSAKACCDSCIAALGGGKGGGKADIANASFQLGGAVTVEAVKQAASSYFAGLL